MASILVTRVQYEEEYGGNPCEGESQMSMPCDETECPGIDFYRNFISMKEY